MPVPQAVLKLNEWVASTQHRTPAYFAALGILAKHGHGLPSKNPPTHGQLAQATATIAQRLREAVGADLGHVTCIAQGLVFLQRAGSAVPLDDLLQALATADFDASSTVVLERWMDAYGFAADDPDVVDSVAVPLPSGLAALAPEQSRRAAPVLSFPLRPTVGGDGFQGQITESVFANAAASDGDAPETLRQQVLAEPQTHDAIPGATVGRELLPDWTLVVDLQMDPPPVSVHLQGLPLLYDPLFDAWTANLRPLPRSECVRLLNALLTIRLTSRDRIHITCRRPRP